MGLRFRKSFKITPKWKFIVLGIVILAIIVALISQRSLTSLNVSWEKTSFEVGESTTVKITPEPVDFDLSNISISDDDFVHKRADTVKAPLQDGFLVLYYHTEA